MKNLFVSNLRVSNLVVPVARKRFSVRVAILALIGMSLAYILIRDTQVFISYLFLFVMGVSAGLIGLFSANKFTAAQQLVVISLWLLVAYIGLSQGDANTLMLTGFLMLTMIAGYAFYPRGVLVLAIASGVVITITGWMDAGGAALHKVDLQQPVVKVIIGLLFLLVGGSYYIYSLEILGRNYMKMREYKRRYLTLFNDSIDTIVVLDLEMQILDINPSGLELTGYSLEEILQLSVDDLIFKNENYTEIWEDFQKHRKVGAFEHELLTKNGDLIGVESIPTEVTDEDGKPLYYIIHMRDVRSRKVVEEYLNQFKERYEAMFERAEYGFLLLDMNLNTVAANQQAAAILKYSLSELHNQSFEKMLKLASYKELSKDIDKLKATGDLPLRQYRLGLKNGTILWVESNLSLVDTNGDHPQYMQWVLRDITEQKQREIHLLNSLQEMETLAMTDPLTGLQNRRSIQHYGQIELENCLIENQPFCVILIDMDALKMINDTFGHHIGDLALSECAQMLMKGKRRHDAVGRWGGDEFLMVLPATSLHDAEIVANRINKKINTIVINQTSPLVRVSVSMGLAGIESLPDEVDLSFGQLVVLADQSMYVAKQNEDSQISVAFQSEKQLLVEL